MGAELLRSFLDLSTQEGKVLGRAEPSGKDLDQRLGQLVLPVIVLLGFPTLQERVGEPLPRVFLNDRVVGRNPAEPTVDSHDRQGVDPCHKQLGHLASHTTTLVGLREPTVAHDLASHRHVHRLGRFVESGDEQHDFGQRLDPSLVEAVGMQVVTLAHGLTRRRVKALGVRR